MKLVNDPVHGYMELHPLLLAVANTPEFQRLRRLKQLGCVYLVYPGASHNRFEHSLGVAHLAGAFLGHLRRAQPTLPITDVHVLVAQLAGLCHDLGHGPLSHAFEDSFMAHAGAPGWRHEHASAALLRHLLEVHHLRPVCASWGLGPAELHLAQELIFGAPSEAPEDWKWVGLPPDQAFLFDIVSNKRNGCDVDKFEYFARDCQQLNFRRSFDSERLMRHARVQSVDGVSHVCFHEKERWNVYALFQTRHDLHRRAYQHPKARAAQHMMGRALLLAEPVLDLVGATQSMDAYALLTDDVFDRVRCSKDEHLEEARALLRRVESGDLYVLAAEVKLTCTHVDEEEVRAIVRDLRVTADIGDVILDVVTIDCGAGAEDPVSRVDFFDDVGRLTHVRDGSVVSKFVPRAFQEAYLRAYCTDPADAPVASAVLPKALQRHFGAAEVA